MLPDSMRIHMRKCNSRNPQKPSKKRLRERRLNPPKPKKPAKRNLYQSNQRPTSDRNQNVQNKRASHTKYKSQRNAQTNGYGQKYKSRLSNSQRTHESNHQRKPATNGRAPQPGSHRKNFNKRASGQHAAPSRRQNGRKAPKYDDFEAEFDRRADQRGDYNPSRANKRQPNSSQRGFNSKPDMFRELEAEGPPPPSSMSKCRICGRTFASDRIAKHQKACVKASKKPKKVKRFHKVITKREKEKIKKKKAKGASKWKTQHQEFIKQMKYMKKLKQVEDAGGDIRMLAPPPTTENPDLVPCKFCGRKFREAAHERHEGICQKVFGGKKGPTKKAPVKYGKRGKSNRGRKKY